MGYDLCRFQGDVDEELICPVCSGVLEEPLQVRHACHFVRQRWGRDVSLFKKKSKTQQAIYKGGNWGHVRLNKLDL